MLLFVNKCACRPDIFAVSIHKRDSLPQIAFFFVMPNTVAIFLTRLTYCGSPKPSLRCHKRERDLPVSFRQYGAGDGIIAVYLVKPRSGDYLYSLLLWLADPALLTNFGIISMALWAPKSIGLPVSNATGDLKTGPSYTNV